MPWALKHWVYSFATTQIHLHACTRTAVNRISNHWNQLVEWIMGEQQQLLAKTANVPIRSSTGSSTQQPSSQGPSEIELNHYQSVPTSTCGTGGATPNQDLPYLLRKHSPISQLLPFWLLTYKINRTAGNESFSTASNVFEPQLAYSFVKDKVLTGVRGLPAILIGRSMQYKIVNVGS